MNEMSLPSRRAMRYETALCSEAINIGLGKYTFAGETSREEVITRWVNCLAGELPDREYIHQSALNGILVPAGRVQSSFGTGKAVTAVNCFVSDTILDSNVGIMTALLNASETMRRGGGIGYDFSTIRPDGALVKGTHSRASGPLSYMDMFDAMCRTIMSAGSRRGAMMGVLRIDHPDIEAFIDAKKSGDRLRNFNVSVAVTNAFMAAVEADGDWELVHQAVPYDQSNLIMRTREGQRVFVYKTVKARHLWERILRATYAYAEPGVIFIDRVNEMNNLGYVETIAASNPCGEQYLPPNGACVLGSINLFQLVEDAFQASAGIDLSMLKEAVRAMVHLLDNVVEQTQYPLQAQREESLAKRRIGIGVLGLGDALIMCGLRYGSPEAIAQTEEWMRVIRDAAYDASVWLAAEKGAFPAFDEEQYLERPFIRALPETIRDNMRAHGIRNGCLLSHAPTGTISLFNGNVSSGIEPVFSWIYHRNVLVGRDPATNVEIKEKRAMFDPAFKLWCDMHGKDPEDPETVKALPAFFVRASDLTVEEHVRMQAICQRYVDSAISKTVNCPEHMTFDDFAKVYGLAWDLGVKGCTTYRPNSASGRGQVLEVKSEAKAETPTPVPAPAEHAKRSPLPKKRPATTMEIEWPPIGQRVYLHVTHQQVGERCLAMECFANSDSMNTNASLVAVMKLMSHIMKRGCEPKEAISKLKTIHDGEGAWVDGKFYPSLLALVATRIEAHMDELEAAAPGTSYTLAVAARPSQESATGSVKGQQCGTCGEYAVVMEQGCAKCLNCGQSKCG